MKTFALMALSLTEFFSQVSFLNAQMNAGDLNALQQNKLVEPDIPTGIAAQRDAELGAQATPFIDAFRNIQGNLTPNGRALVFVSNRSGLPQLYVSDTRNPRMEPRHLAPIKERVDTPVVTPDGNAVVFRSDQGANEHWRIYRVNLDGSDLIALTPDVDLEHDYPIIPQGTPNQLFYSAREPSSATTTIYSQSALKPSPPKAIYTDSSPGTLGCVSRDGRWGIYLRNITFGSEDQVIVIDMHDKTARQIYPASSTKASISGLACSADASRIYIATDGGEENGLVLALDRVTGQELERYRETDPTTAQLQDVVISPNGKYLAIKVNAGSKNRIQILDAHTLKLKTVAKLPTGSGFVGNFNKNGKSLAVEWTTPNAPYDLFQVDTTTGRVAALRQELRAGLTKLSPIDVSVEDVPSFDGLKVPINIYKPQWAATSGQHLPVVVYIHGGPAFNSVVRWNAQLRFLLAQGYAIVEPNIRGSTGFGRAYELADNGHKRLDAVRDLEQVALWIKQQPWADKDRLIAMGLSGGGYLVMMAVTYQPTLWRAGVDMYGVVDLRTFMKGTSGEIRETLKREFGDLESDGDFLDSISPIHKVDKIIAPLFVYAGANDPRVPRSQSDQIVAALHARNSVVEYMVADNEGHSLDRRDNQLAFISHVARFLETNLSK